MRLMYRLLLSASGFCAATWRRPERSTDYMKLLCTVCLGLIAAAAPAIGQVEPVAPAANAVSASGKNKVVWLLLAGWGTEGMTALPMASRDQCEQSGAEFLTTKRLLGQSGYRGFECLDGIR